MPLLIETCALCGKPSTVYCQGKGDLPLCVDTCSELVKSIVGDTAVYGLSADPNDGVVVILHSDGTYWECDVYDTTRKEFLNNTGTVDESEAREYFRLNTDCFL